jgi:hypothetical protein
MNTEEIMAKTNKLGYDELTEILSQPGASAVITAVHPAALRFPKMTAPELEQLAADIKENGLRYPIMLDSKGEMLVDGRNRVAACRIAGVEPIFERLPEDQNPAAYIMSANMHRRDLTKGQKAMLWAMEYPEPAAVKRKGTGSTAAVDLFSGQLLSNARVVLKAAPDQVELVVSGAISLDEAYKIARERLAEASGTEARMARLRDDAPDLADMVAEERLTLQGAEAEVLQRSENQRIARDHGKSAAKRLAGSIVDAGVVVGGIEAGETGLITEELCVAVERAAQYLRQHLGTEAE